MQAGLAVGSTGHENDGKGGCCGGHHDHGAHSHGTSSQHGAHDHSHASGGGRVDQDQAGSAKATDPVCGMKVDPATAKHRFAYKGQDYFFCSAGCRTKFEADPDKYLAPKSSAPAEKLPEGTIYTCPMHPEIRQVGPGNCPICGMTLEPETVSLDDKPDPELIDMTRRFWIALVLTLPVFVMDMTVHLADIHLLPGQTSNWISFVLATPVVLWAGWPFFERGLRSVVTRNLNMFTLIAMGTGVAYVYSVVATLIPQAFPDAFRDMARCGRGVFRSRRRHHRAGAAGSGARTARPRTNLRCDPCAARPCAENRAAHCGGRRRGYRHRRHRGG